MRWRRKAAPSASPEPAPPEQVSPELLAWAQAVDATQLSDRTVKMAEHFLRDYRHLNYLARREGGLRLRSVIEAEVRPGPPASIAMLDVAATVLAARRRQLGIE